MTSSSKRRGWLAVQQRIPRPYVWASKPWCVTQLTSACGLRAAQSPQALVSCVTHQGFEAQTYGLGIRCCTASHPRLFEELVIDVERFLHTSNSAIRVWLSKPYCEPSA